MHERNIGLGLPPTSKLFLDVVRIAHKFVFNRLFYVLCVYGIYF